MTHRFFDVVCMRLVGDDEIDVGAVKREFPTVRVERSEVCGDLGIVVDDHVWRGAFDLRTLDHTVACAGSLLSISVRGYDVVGIAREVLTRYQRFFGRRNDASSTPSFDAALRTHASIYDVSRPLMNEACAHALDTWQWTLRLKPEAGAALQLAALFHDVDRLDVSPRQRVEHRALDHRPVKVASVAGGERIQELLAEAGVDAETAKRAREIVSGQERGGDTDVLLLDDADALSFLSLSSSDYVDHFGVAQARRKVAHTLSRLGARAMGKLDTVRLRPDVERLLREVAA